jgi:hypothetical protein
MAGEPINTSEIPFDLGENPWANVLYSKLKLGTQVVGEATKMMGYHDILTFYGIEVTPEDTVAVSKAYADSMICAGDIALKLDMAHPRGAGEVWFQYMITAAMDVARVEHNYRKPFDY